MDLVNYAQPVFDRIVRDFGAFAERSGIGSARFVPMSALTGDMIVDRGPNLDWYEGPTLLQILETVDVAQTLADAPFRFPVQYVARPITGGARGYMGRIESGSIAVGDRVTALPSGRTTRVREIRGADGTQENAGLHAGITLALDDELDIGRGDMLVREYSTPSTTTAVEATVCWLSDTAYDPRRKYLLRHTTREVRARIERIDHRWNVSTQQREPAMETLAMNDIGSVALTLAQPVFADRYADNRATGSFVLIDESSNNTVSAGLIA